MIFSDFSAYVRGAVGDDVKNISPRVASSLLDQYVDEVLMDRATEDAGSAGTTPAARRQDLIAKRARLEEISDEELKKEYDAHPERYRKPPLIRVSQLLFPDRQAAEAAVRRLRGGASWLEVSRTSSIAPNAAEGGPLGLLAASDLPRDFEKVLWALPAGKMTPILEAPHGFHVFRVEERLDARDVPFEEAEPGLRVALAEERSTQAAEEIVRRSRLRHPPSVVEEHLPFPYVGTLPRLAAPQ